MIKREAKFTVLFRHWLKAHWSETAVFELKQTTGLSIRFDAVEEHQIEALLAAKHSELIYKAPDDSRGVKPFDLFMVVEVPAYIVIRYPTAFVIIDVDDFVEEKENNARQSLFLSRALEVCSNVVWMDDLR